MRPFYVARQVIVNKTEFSSLGLSAPLLSNLDGLGYHQMTPIQARALPVILSGGDLIAQAKTGSGKTAAFGLGVLSRINPRWFAVQALVLCPTRELADQVAREIRRLARAIDNIKVVTLTGGTPMGPQIGSLSHGAHIVVGTPGRLHDHLFRETLDLSKVETLVLDEADRMVDMGFYEEITGIVDACAKKRQTLLFSATYPDNIRKLAARFLKNPEQIRLESLNDTSRIEQRFYKVSPEARISTVAAALAHFRPASTLVFCNTKEQVKNMARDLSAQGFSSLALYGDLEQRDRDEILLQFAAGCASVLVATDVAARGLDITTLSCVVNADLAHDPEIHIHRIGRTGRGHDKGLALSLVVPSDGKRLAQIEVQQQGPANWRDLKELVAQKAPAAAPAMALICMTGGKKDKIRPGDILGALTGDAGLPGSAIGKISVSDNISYVAIERARAKEALAHLDGGRVKGRNVKARLV
nr:ATP-dependent RNA helicase DbpA [Craterilacuibacter sp. RT1T]